MSRTRIAGRFIKGIIGKLFRATKENWGKITFVLNSGGLIVNLSEVLDSICKFWDLTEQDKKDLKWIAEKGKELDKIHADIKRNKIANDHFVEEIQIFNSFEARVTKELLATQKEVKYLVKKCELLYRQEWIDQLLEYRITESGKPGYIDLNEYIRTNIYPKMNGWEKGMLGASLMVNAGSLLWDYKNRNMTWESYEGALGTSYWNNFTNVTWKFLNFMRQTAAPILSIYSITHFVYYCKERNRSREEVQARIKKMKEGYEGEAQALQMLFVGYKEGIDDPHIYERLKRMFIGKETKDITKEEAKFFATGLNKILSNRKEIVKHQMKIIEKISEEVEKLSRSVNMEKESNDIHHIKKQIKDTIKKYDQKGEDKEEREGLSIVKHINEEACKLLGKLKRIQKEIEKKKETTQVFLQLKAQAKQLISLWKKEPPTESDKRKFIKFVVNTIKTQVESMSVETQNEWKEEKLENCLRELINSP